MRRHEERKLEELRKEEYHRKVRQQNEEKLQLRTQRFQWVQSSKEEKLRQTSENRVHDLVIQKEILNSARLSKRRIVERIMRANEYQKHQVLLKIERDTDRSENLRQQKIELINARRQQRDDQTRMKEAIGKKFTQLSRKGDFDVS